MTFTNPIANLNSYTPLGVPLEPTQLFEAAVELANFFILMWLFKRKKFDGQVLAAFLILYGIARYFLEFLRDDPGRGSVFGGIMTGTQLISICLVITGGFIWWLKSSPRAVPAHAPAIDQFIYHLRRSSLSGTSTSVDARAYIARPTCLNSHS